MQRLGKQNVKILMGCDVKKKKKLKNHVLHG